MTSKVNSKRILKRKYVSNLTNYAMDSVMGGTSYLTISVIPGAGCIPPDFTISCEHICNGKPTSMFLCDQTNWYCCL